MKVQVTFFVSGQKFKETYVVSNLEDAKRTAALRQPTAKAIAYNPVY